MKNPAVLISFLGAIIIVATAIIDNLIGNPLENIILTSNSSTTFQLYELFDLFYIVGSAICLAGFLTILYNSHVQYRWLYWLNYILLGLIPLMLVVSQAGGAGVMAGPGPEEILAGWGVLLIIWTILYTLYHRFYLTTGVTNSN